MQTHILLLLCSLCVACHASTMFTFSLYDDSNNNYGMSPSRVNLATGNVTRFKSAVEYWGGFQPQTPLSAFDQKRGLLYFTPNQAIPRQGIIPAIYTYDTIHNEMLPIRFISAPIHGIAILTFDNVNLYTVACEDIETKTRCTLFRAGQNTQLETVSYLDSGIFMKSLLLAATIDDNSGILYLLYTPSPNNGTSFITAVDLPSGKIANPPIAIRTYNHSVLSYPAWFDQSTGRILVIGIIMTGNQPYLSLFKIDPKTGSYTSSSIIPSNYPTVFALDFSTNLLWIVQEQFPPGAPELLQSFNIRTGKLGQPQVLNGAGTTLAAEIDTQH